MLTNKLGGYTSSGIAYTQPKTTKYTKEELEEAKNSVQNLGKGIGSISQTNTNNYRKQFKPQLENNDSIYAYVNVFIWYITKKINKGFHKKFFK